MKKLLGLILIALLLLPHYGCKKAIEQIAEDLIVKAMTDGEWAVTSFKVDANDITSDFSGYTFKYYSNRTVQAILNGSVQYTGEWDGNAVTKTTWADFPGAAHPVSLTNGSWEILNNSWTFVEARQVTGGTTRLMRLDKL